MKLKLLLSFTLFFIFIGAASAQTGKGAFYIGGSVGYNYSSYGSESTYNYLAGYTDYYLTKVANLNISPEFGFFLGKKWSIGIAPTFARSSGTETSYYYSYTGSADNTVTSDTYHTTTVGIGIDVRYYCMITEKFGFFPQFGVSTQNNSVYFGNGTLAIGATPNFVFFPTPKLGVNLGFGDVGYTLDYKTKDHTINAGLNNNITFGLNYFWGRK
jgi:hypothetical protein